LGSKPLEGRIPEKRHPGPNDNHQTRPNKKKTIGGNTTLLKKSAAKGVDLNKRPGAGYQNLRRKQLEPGTLPEDHPAESTGARGYR